jgi:hypothetical protein
VALIDGTGVGDGLACVGIDDLTLQILLCGGSDQRQLKGEKYQQKFSCHVLYFFVEIGL